MNIDRYIKEKILAGNKVRIVVSRDMWHAKRYTIQVKHWVFFWAENSESSRKPSSVMWCLHNLGVRLRDIDFVGGGADIQVFREQEFKLDHFPFHYGVRK